MYLKANIKCIKNLLDSFSRAALGNELSQQPNFFLKTHGGDDDNLFI